MSTRLAVVAVLVAAIAPGVHAATHSKKTSATAAADQPAPYVAPPVKTPPQLKPGEMYVSVRDQNQFAFPSPIVHVITPRQSDLSAKPVYMVNNTQVLLEFSPRDPSSPNVRVIFELENGAVIRQSVVPTDMTDGAFKVFDAGEVRASALPGVSPPKSNDYAQGDSPYTPDVELLKQVMKGTPPPGFDRMPLPGVVDFDKFRAIPLWCLSDGTKKISAFSLVAQPGKRAVVDPSQFYRPGITNIQIEGDVVDDASSPTLFAVEEVR